MDKQKVHAHDAPSGSQSAKTSANSPVVDPSELEVSPELKRQLLQLILERTRPARMPVGFSFLGRAPEVRELADPAKLRRALNAMCTSLKLMCAGIFDRDQKWTPPLSNKFLILRDATGAPVGLASDAGSLFAAEPCAAEIDFDAANGSHLFLGTLTDVQILTRLGFPCTNASGLTQLSGAAVRRFLGRSIGERILRYTLVGVDFTNPTTSIPGHLRLILKRLAEIKDLYNIPPEREIKIWWPGAAGLRRLRLAPKYPERTILRDIVAQSAQTSSLPASQAWQRLNQVFEPSPLEAYRELNQAIEQSRRFPRREAISRALHRYRRAGERYREHYMSVAAKATSPLEAALLLLNGEAMAHLHQTRTIVRQAETVLQGRHPDEAHVSPNDTLKNIERLGNVLVKIGRQPNRKK